MNMKISMNKFLILSLSTIPIFGTSATAGAAANPFIDVPAGHWAYDSVTKLANEGVIEGYGDGTYRGNRNITRYEMAQMIARALARAPKTNISSSSRAELDKLAAEFRDELDNLGVRVAELEKHSDKVKWTSKIEYEYDNIRLDPDNTGHKDKAIINGYIFRFEPSAEINDHWSANARIDAYVDTKADTTYDFNLIRGWVEGNYDNFNIKLGKQEFWTNESSLVWDDNFSGAVLTLGNKFQTTLLAGRFSPKVGGGLFGQLELNEDPADILGVNLQYNSERGLYGGAGWYNVKDDDLKTPLYSKDGNEDKANIWSANGGYKFGSMVNLWGSYAKNTKADYENSSWQIQFDLGNYVSNYGLEKGDWGLWTGYRRFGTNVSFSPLEDDVMRGTKGWFVGGAYAPMNNVGLMAKYFNGKYITGGGDAEKLMLLAELFY